MKVKKQKKQNLIKKASLITTVVLLTVLVITSVLFAISGSILGWKPFTHNSQPTVVEPTKNNPVDNTKDKGGTTGTDKTTDQVPVSEDLSVTITNLSQSGGFVRFSGSTNDAKSGGSCSIVFTNPNDKPISRSISAVIANGKATCGPIEIPETEFSAIGEWTVTYRYYINDTQTVTERTINIQ